MAHPARPTTELSGARPFFSQDARVPVVILSNNAHKFPPLRAHGLLRRLLQILTMQYRRREPVCLPWFPSAGVQFRRREHAPRAPFLGHGPSSAKGTHPHSAVPLSRSINSATEVHVSNATPLKQWQGSLRFTNRSSQPRVAQQ